MAEQYSQEEAGTRAGDTDRVHSEQQLRTVAPRSTGKQEKQEGGAKKGGDPAAAGRHEQAGKGGDHTNIAKPRVAATSQARGSGRPTGAAGVPGATKQPGKVRHQQEQNPAAATLQEQGRPVMQEAVASGKDRPQSGQAREE